MALSILRTKLFVPPLRPETVPRRSLFRRLDAAWQRPLALVSAPAGFGKTTLVANWIHERDHDQALPIAWLSLEESDNDPVRFLTYLVAAWQKAVPGLSLDVAALLPAQPPLAVEGILTELLNELTAVGQPATLVLDDYHVIQDETIHHGVAFLLDHMPPHLHLIVITRQDPPLPLARLRGRGQLLEIRQADLAFTAAETAQFLNEMMGLNLPQTAVTALVERTEGWIAGLQMAAVSMQGSEDVDEFVAAFTGSHRYVLDYLMEEVLQRQAPEIQQFLQHTAVLDELTAPLCDHLLAQSSIARRQSQQILEYLDRANLFIIPLDDERRWYRYHHLFADLLRRRLQQTEPERVKTLHCLAGAWYAENGRLAQAIDHYLQGEAYARAAAAVDQIAEDYLMRSHTIALRNWFRQLPDEEIRARPMLCLYQAGVMLLDGESMAAIDSRLQDALHHEGDEVGAEINVIRALIGVIRGEVRQSMVLSQEALALLPPDNLFLRSLVAQNVAFAHTMQGDVPLAIESMLAAAAESGAAGNIMSQVISLAHAAEMHMVGGRLSAAERLYEEAYALATEGRKRPLPIAGMAQSGLGEVWREWNRLEKADTAISQGLDLVQHWGQLGALDGYIWLAKLRYSQNDAAGVMNALDKASDIAAGFDASEVDDVFVNSFRARFAAMQGDVEAAVRWQEASNFLQVDYARTAYHLWEMGQITLAWIRLSQGQPWATVEILQTVLPRARPLGRFGTVIDALGLQAVAYEQAGRRSQGLVALDEALTLAQPEKFVRIFVDKGEPVQRLLKALGKGVAGTRAAYIHKLLAAFEVSLAGSHPPLIDPLTDRQLEVLHLIAAGYTNREIAEQLVVALSTVKTHVNHIYSKLAVRRRTDAIRRAHELGLIDD